MTIRMIAHRQPTSHKPMVGCTQTMFSRNKSFRSGPSVLAFSAGFIENHATSPLLMYIAQNAKRSWQRSKYLAELNVYLSLKTAFNKSRKPVYLVSSIRKADAIEPFHATTAAKARLRTNVTFSHENSPRRGYLKVILENAPNAKTTSVYAVVAPFHVTSAQDQDSHVDHSTKGPSVTIVRSNA